MKYLALVLMIIAAVGCYIPIYQPAPKQGVITRWIDGDTCEIRCESGDGVTWLEKVRLHGVDTPEANEPGFHEAPQASKAIYPPGQLVELSYPERRKQRIVYRDNFGRLLATLHISKKGVSDGN